MKPAAGLPAARKKYAQHFLIDERFVQKIIDGIAASPDDRLIEIGAGNGVLTFPLAESCRTLIALEIDGRLYRQLEQKKQTYPSLQPVCADALRYDFAPFSPLQVRIVGNLPYNVAIPIIEKLLDTSHIQDMHFLVQQEIAQRLLAAPGHSHYGRLSLLCASAAQGEVLFDVPAACFHPMPKIVSSFIRLIPQPLKELENLNRRLMDQLIRAAFNRKNRKLRNTLAEHNCAAALDALNLAEKRARDAELKDFISLTRRIEDESRRKK